MRVRIDDGCVLEVEEAGGGPAVVCIQGVGVAGSGWRPQLAGLSDAYRLIAFDNRGIGGSSLGDAGVSVEQYAADTLALMDALGLERAHIMGHSLGGVVAQQLALDAPSRVQSLVLMCTLWRAKDAARPNARVIWTGLKMMLGTRRVRQRAFLSNVLPDEELAAADLDELVAKLEPLFGRDLAKTPPIVWKQTQALGRHDTSSRLEELRGIPALVLSGSHDVIAPPAQGKALAEAVGGRYIEWEDAAHGLPITHAERTNDLLRGFWAEHALGTTQAESEREVRNVQDA